MRSQSGQCGRGACRAFLSAQSEHEFAAVMAHEIAHLSQRHYARRLEQQERNTPLTIAGILAGIILTAATGSPGRHCHHRRHPGPGH